MFNPLRGVVLATVCGSITPNIGGSITAVSDRWWPSDNGKMCITVRYGARTLEVVDGKNAIETENIAGVITTLEVLRTAVDAGELDARIEAVSGLVKAGFDKEAAPTTRSTIKLPAKAN